MVRPRSFDAAFAAHEVSHLGRLRVPTGRLVACDPFFSSLAAPLTRPVPPGDYDVQICMADAGVQGRRVALARVVIEAARMSSRYEPARHDLGDSVEYSVESGLGAFMDEAARTSFVHAMARYYHDQPDGNYYTEILAAEFAESAVDRADPDDAGTWAVHALPSSGLNVAMFASGHGDDSYRSFWCLDESGEPVSLGDRFPSAGGHALMCVLNRRSC